MQGPRVYTTGSPEETEKLGERLSSEFGEGERVALVGELGGGKTRFVRGVARGLGSKGFIKSPSFTIINVYEGGRLPLYHMDLYRIGRAEELFEAGVEEYIYGKGISIIEWADKVPALLNDCTVVIRFSYAGETQRVIEVERCVRKEIK
jgi:tRNA threonylcarbamoyladenosine biosynthesis protein TsaE